MNVKSRLKSIAQDMKQLTERMRLKFTVDGWKVDYDQMTIGGSDPVASDVFELSKKGKQILLRETWGVVELDTAEDAKSSKPFARGGQKFDLDSSKGKSDLDKALKGLGAPSWGKIMDALGNAKDKASAEQPDEDF